MKYQRFQTTRLLIRPTLEKDASFILNLFNSPKWLKYIGDRNLKTVEQAQHYIKEKMLPQLHELGYSNYTIIRKEDKEKIGICGLYNRESLDGIDLGFAFLSDYEGKGYAFEASSKITQVAFDIFKLPLLRAITDTDNLSSQKLLKKLGFKSEGLINLASSAEELLLFSKRLDKTH